MKLQKIIIQLIFITLILPTIYSANCGNDIKCNCGDTITSSYTMTENLHCEEENGLTLKANINCNGYEITGTNYGTAVIIKGIDNRIIQNCRIENFSKGIYITTGKITHSTGWGRVWQETTYTDNTKIINNIFKNNQYGIITSKNNYDIITNNTFINNSIQGLETSGKNSQIYNNKFYKNGIHYSITNNNQFCKDEIDNKYFTGATGPQCNCLIPFDNLKINSYTKLCENTYEIKSPMQIMGGTLNCQNSTLFTTQNNNGITTEGYDNSKILNCNLQNFSTAIRINYRYEREGNGWGGSWNVYYYSDNTNITNNSFKNNKYGIIVTQKSKKSKITKNEFENNSIYPINIDKTSTATIWQNIFHTKTPYYATTAGKIFCNNNISNLYLNNLSGPTCNCYTLHNYLNINSKIKICKDTYNIEEGITISSNAEIDCQDSTLIGKNKNNAIFGEDIKNTKITNCNIENFSNGIYFKENSYDNEITYSTFNNIINGIVLQNKARTTEIHNNIILATNFNIYNNNAYQVNATNNWWGTTNTTLIKSKLLNPETIISEPFIKNGPELDLSISEKDINFDLKNNKINLKIQKSKLVSTPKFEIEILDVFNYKIINKKTINITNINNIEINWNLNYNHEYHINIDPDNNLYENNKENNYAKQFLFDKKTYYLNVNTNSYIGNDEIKNYLFEKLGIKNYIGNIENADIIINISIQNKEYSNEYFNYNLIENKNPYEANIKTSFENNKQKINIQCADIDGCITATKKIINEKTIYFNSNYEFRINKTNIEAIKIYDFLRINQNLKYYKTETTNFGNIINDALNNNLNQIRELTIPINSPNGTINYKLQNIIPLHSINYREYIDKDSYPVVMAGGLWSDITTWKELGTELANEGYEIYLIEITGGKSECDDCYNYQYEFLTDIVYPKYLNKILNLSGKEKIKYIGHSNGARTALDSLTLGKFDSKKIDTLIAVGVPGAFEELSMFAKIIKDSGDTAIEKLNEKNCKHSEISTISALLNNKLANKLAFPIYILDSNNKISTNLFKQYYRWINDTNDKQPGENLTLNYFALIYGDLIQNSDSIIPIIDEIRIYNNIISNSKYINKTRTAHIGMSTNEKVKKEIKRILNKEIYKNENKQ